MPWHPKDMFPGDGEMARLCRRFDWATTALGPVEEWSIPLRTTVSTLLSAGHPMLMFWGPEHVQIYNDAYGRTLGDRHPAALGAQAAAFWTDVWEVMEPQIQQVMSGGGATWFEDQEGPIRRDGRMDRARWTYSYGPVRGQTGDIEGVLVLPQETTGRGQAEAQVRMLVDHLEGVLESMTDGFLILDLEWRLTFVNAEASRLVERPREDLIGKSIWEAFPEAVGSPFEEGIRRARQEQTTVQFDEHFPSRHRWLEIRAYSCDKGLAVYLLDITSRREAETQLRDSERRFRELAESMPFIVWTADPMGAVDYHTKALMDITGRTGEGLVPEAWLEIVHPDDRAHTLECWMDAVEKGDAYGVEFRIRRHDGVYRWHLTRAVPVRNEAGEIVKWYGSSTDIHDLRDGEARVRESEERFRVVARATTDAIWDWDLRRDEIWWGEGLEMTFGATGGAVPRTNDNRSERIHPEDRERIRQEMTEVIEGSEEDWQGEYRFRRGDGGYAWVVDRAFVIRDGEGRAVRMVGGMSDETHEMEAQRRIREQAELLDLAREAILVRRMDHTVEYWNAGAEAIYGWSREEAVGRSVRDLLHNQQTPFAEAMEKVVRDGEWRGELEQVRRDGTPIVVEASWSLLRAPDGTPRRILAIHTDVTERNKLQAQFFRAQRLESIGTLAGGIAHDLNNVLSPILMSLGLLRTMWKDEESIDILSTIEGSARRGADMVRQVLAFARGVDGVRVSVDLSRIVDDLGRVVRDTFPRQITFRARVPPGLWHLAGDPTQIHQVLMNLFVNARDAMPGGGGLTVEAANVQLDQQYAAMSHVSQPGPYVRIAVADTGEGMAPATLERVFEPFFTTKDVGSGTGLGLSTVDAIVRSHGGFVNVYSEPGKGTTFRVYFPAGERADVPVEDSVGTLPPGRGELILVVDDETAVRTIIQRTLEAFGYRVVTASDGAEAVVVFAQRGHEVDLVLTDISMPVMDGPATIRALLRMDPDLRIVATSGHGGDGGSALAAAYGVRDFIGKPYTAEALLDVVQRVLADGSGSGAGEG